MGIEPLETAESHEHPACRQLSVFLENRLGQLLRVTRLIEDEPVRILGLSVDGTIDCAIVRLLVDDPDAARTALVDSGFAVTESEVMVVELPPGKRGIMAVSSALIAGEVNINYLYPVWPSETHGPCLAIQVDDEAQAVRALATKRLRIIHQFEL
jgi:hypothetical protein